MSSLSLAIASISISIAIGDGTETRSMVRGCMCATSWCDLDLTFDLAVVTLSLKILSGLYLGNRKVSEVDTW